LHDHSDVVSAETSTVNVGFTWNPGLFLPIRSPIPSFIATSTTCRQRRATWSGRDLMGAALTYQYGHAIRCIRDSTGSRSSGSEYCWTARNVYLFTATVGHALSPTVVQEYRTSSRIFRCTLGVPPLEWSTCSRRVGTSAFHGSAWDYNRISAYIFDPFDNDSKRRPQRQVCAQSIRIRFSAARSSGHNYIF